MTGTFRALLCALFCAALLALPCVCLSPLSPSTAHAADETTIRVGYFPNITHAHALIAQSMTAEGAGWFEQRLPGARLEWAAFNAGPSAMEALFAKAVDMTYVGPNPALNAFTRSRGKDVRVVAGAVRGGAALVIPKGSFLRQPADFKGKRVATPQLGNTQDIACRHWFTQAGLRVTMTGGDVTIIPTPNAGMSALFATGKIEAAWTVEPWVSRLEMENDGTILYEEPAAESVTTILVSSEAFRTKHADLLAAFRAAHLELTEWIKAHPEEAQKRVADELTRQMKREFPLDLVRHAWPRLTFDAAIGTEDFAFSLRAAQSAGFLQETPELDGLVLP